MALTVGPTFLVDTSALARLDRTEVAARLGPLLIDGEVATCGTAMLEFLYTARTGRDYVDGARMLHGLPRAPIDDAVIDRALRTQASLATSAQHRGATLPDLLLAATAAAAGLTVLHYDSDFDRIAAVTGQPVEWVVPRGSVD